MASAKPHEPSPRFGHGAVPFGGRCYLWGGCVQDVTESGRRKIASTIEIFYSYLETWEEHPTTGVPPPGLYFGACTSLLGSLYWFGGYDGKSVYNSFHRLDLNTLEWRELHQAGRPMRKSSCGIVPILRDQLALFGGYGIPTGLIQPRAAFTKNRHYTDGSGWSNELHMFNITESKWSSPPTTGPRPPPCSRFSFTAINNYQAVLFGGYQPGCGRVSDCYLMDFESMEWTKLKRLEGASWPVERSGHAACCLNYGEEHPQLLVSGGVDENNVTLDDVWILDVKSGSWRPREVTLPEGAYPRIGHTATALSLELGRTQVNMFGGCPKWESGKSHDALPKLAKTTVLELESVELPPSGDCPSTREWVLVGNFKSSHLGSRKRLPELEKMKQTKAGSVRDRELQELKQMVCQLKDEVAMEQRQSRLALTRAVSAEKKANKVPVLEQQLAQTKANLKEQIHMKDQARIAAEQQLQQTKATLEHKIQVRDQKLSQQKEINNQAKVFTQQQFNHHVEALKLQMQVKLQVLMQQIQDKDWGTVKLEQQLHQNEEQIQGEEIEFERQLQHSEGYGEEVMVKVPEMQKHGSGMVSHQKEGASVHQLLQAREQVRAKEEEFGQVREMHEAELSKLTHENAAKQQEIEFEPKAQIRATNEEVNILQSQTDTLQHDQNDLQWQLKAKDIQLAAMNSESKLMQNRTEALMAEMQEQTEQMVKFEAKLKQVEFFRDHYSQEVEQLKRELMDKILEIESLRKQQEGMVPADTLPTTTSAVKHENVPTNTFEMKDQKTQTENVEIKEQLVQTECTAQQQDDSDKVEVKDQPAKNETVDLHVQAGDTVQQQEYLRGFETFAETSFNISDSHSHSFEWKGHGLKLHIPEGAVPAEHTECKIDIKVGMTGQFRIPDDLQHVSCIYWLRGPQSPFLKPITLEIEHCASLQDSSQSESLRFVVAKCSQTELPYEFRELKMGKFAPQSSYGSVHINQFSYFAITIPRRYSWFQQYYSSLFYIQKGFNKWHVDFVITLYLQVCFEAIQDKYSHLDAISGPGFMVQFENDTIMLAIPEDGVCLENGWTITPLVPPVIDKQQVDGFRSWQEAPYCRLQVKLDKDKKPQELEYKVKLQGAKHPRDFFTITCPPEEFAERPNVTDEQRKQFGGSEQCGVLKERHFSTDTCTPSPLTTDSGFFSASSESTAFSPRGGEPEKKPILKDLIDALYHKVADKWKVIGVLLEIPKGTLSRIAEKHQRDPCSCLVEMLETWLERVYPPPTWTAIIEAAEFLGEEQLGKELREKYYPTVSK